MLTQNKEVLPKTIPHTTLSMVIGTTPMKSMLVRKKESIDLSFGRR
jgi:hypothetical protein